MGTSAAIGCVTGDRLLVVGLQENVIEIVRI
jgi:hypothetical protein